MNTQQISSTLKTLFSELVDGSSGPESYMLNRGDPGLFRSLDKLSAQAASSDRGGASIAAHADHLRYGLSLMNRWSAGEEPFATADWSQSWRIRNVSESEWKQIRADLEAEARRWADGLDNARDVSQAEMNGVVSVIAHLAYHLGAIRQIDRASRGPAEQEIAR